MPSVVFRDPYSVVFRAIGADGEFTRSARSSIPPNEFRGAAIPITAHDLIGIEFPALQIGLRIDLDNQEATWLSLDDPDRSPARHLLIDESHVNRGRDHLPVPSTEPAFTPADS